MRLLIVILFLSSSSYTIGQNLVPNPSFENLDPNKIDTINWTRPSDNWDHSYVPVNWFLPTIGSSNIFNTQGLTSGWGVPLNLFGQQAARSGNSYAGLYTLAMYSNSREYISVKLLDTLKPNTNYYVSFNVSCADDFLYGSKIGAFLGSDSINIPSFFKVLNLMPQIESANAITDKNIWTRISGMYVASGGEEYITLGNFRDSINSDSTYIGNGIHYAAYYYIDDVCVSTDSLTCYNFVGLKDPLKNTSVSIHPNPTSGAISINLNESKSGALRVLNSLGQIVFEEAFKATRELKIALDGPFGLYFVQLEVDGELITKKVVKE